MAEGVVEALAGDSRLDYKTVHEWVVRSATDPEPKRRALAARVAGAVGQAETNTIAQLLADTDPHVAVAAIDAAGRTKDRAHLFAVVKLLANYQTRGAAIEALAHLVPRSAGTLGDMLEDENTSPELRIQIPRVLKRSPIKEVLTS